MKNSELVSRVSNQVRTITRDDYISDRFILSTAQTTAAKFITQKLQKRSLNRYSSLYKEVKCIEFELEDIFKCPYVEFRSCDKISKSKKSLKNLGLVFTRYGSSIKELYSIDRKSTVFTESTLYQSRINSQRQGGKEDTNKFYILDDHIYVTREVKALSGLILSLDQYELDSFCDCEDSCESAWEKNFIAPDSLIEDIISYTIQNILQSKQIPVDEKGNMNSNEK